MNEPASETSDSGSVTEEPGADASSTKPSSPDQVSPHAAATTAKPDNTASKPASAVSSGSSPRGAKGKSLIRTLIRTLVGVLGGVLVLGLVGYASLPWWVNDLPPTAQTLALRLLPTPMEQIDKAQIEGDINAVRGAMEIMRTAVNTVQERVARLESQLDAMTAPHAATGDGRPGNQRTEAVSIPQQSATGDGRAQTQGISSPQQTDTSTDGRLTTIERILGSARSALVERLQTLADAVDGLKESRASASAVLDLSDRVASLEGKVTQVMSRQDHALAFLLAVGQLRSVLETGRGFADNLKTVAALAPEDVDMAALTHGFALLANEGIPTLTALQQSFVALAARVIRASALPDETEKWWKRAVDRLSAVVTVRRIDGDAPGDGAAAVVSRAQTLLRQGGLGEAIDEMSRLRGPAAQTAAAWVAQARARLAADKALNTLTARALAGVTAQTLSRNASGEEG